MADGGAGGKGGVVPEADAKRPSIFLPPRSAVESLFRGGPAEDSPGPMTLVSSFFPDDPESECRSFSQLLAGAMGSPVAAARAAVETAPGNSRAGAASLNLGHSRPMKLLAAQSPFFTVPAGLSPGGLLDSPAMFSSNLGQFGISHQQALAQVTAQVSGSNTQMHSQAEYPSSISSASLTQPICMINMETSCPMQSISSNTNTHNSESALAFHSNQKSQQAVFVDKPADDGYNWRKYGQKQVKGSEYPRSYYKCTRLNCPVKKKVERTLDGQVTEIIYKGQHNHQRPPPNRWSKDGASEFNGNLDPYHSDSIPRDDSSNFNRLSEAMTVPVKRDRGSEHGASEQLSNPTDGDDLDDAKAGEAEDGSEPQQKRRNLETRVIESASHSPVTEPKIIVQTTSEVDLLDDGYRWRKYGQKVVKGNPHPRSYYKCTSAGCKVRKHIERASTDRKAVLTTYEGKHSHDVPAARNCSHNSSTAAAASANMNSSASHNIMSTNCNNQGRSDPRNNVQHPFAVLQLKGEHEMA